MYNLHQRASVNILDQMLSWKVRTWKRYILQSKITHISIYSFLWKVFHQDHGSLLRVLDVLPHRDHADQETSEKKKKSVQQSCQLRQKSWDLVALPDIIKLTQVDSYNQKQNLYFVLSILHFGVTHCFNQIICYQFSQKILPCISW